jgi:exosortase/archaeosortase family protein
MAKQKKEQGKQNQSQGASAVPVSAPTSRRPVLQYIGGFLALLVGFYALYTNAFFHENVLQPIVNTQAWLASKFLTLIGYPTGSDGSQISGALTSLNVQKGCDGMEVTALYLIGVLLVPFRWRSKWIGLGYGLAVLFVLNLLRIIILYLAQIHWPSAFEMLHLHGGFALFTVVTIFMWAHWANWAVRQEKTPDHVPA